VDGGAVQNDFLMQLQADIMGVQVIRPAVTETTALGAAYAAGLATGFWTCTQELRKNWQVDRTFKPTWSKKRRDEGFRGWKKAVGRTMKWVDHD